MIAGYSDFKMKAEERQWNMCTDAERPQEDKKCKSKAVWRRQGSRKRARDGKKRLRRCKMWRCNTDAFTHRRSYAETFLHTDAFTYTDAFTHTSFFAHPLLHTDAFTHRHHLHTRAQTRFCAYVFTQALLPTNTETLLHINALRTDELTQENLYKQTAYLHTGAFTHRHLLHTNSFTHRRIYAQTLLLAHAFLYTETLYTQTLYTQTLSHTERHLPHLDNIFGAQPFLAHLTGNMRWKRPSPHTFLSFLFAKCCIMLGRPFQDLIRRSIITHFYQISTIKIAHYVAKTVAFAAWTHKGTSHYSCKTRRGAKNQRRKLHIKIKIGTIQWSRELYQLKNIENLICQVQNKWQ